MTSNESPRRRRTALAALAVAVVALAGLPAVGASAASRPAAASATSATSRPAATPPPAAACAVPSLAAVHRPGLAVTAATAVTSGHLTPPGGAELTGLPAFCAVSAVQRDAAGNPQRLAVWLPLAGWNHAFEGVGGGGYSCGISWPALAAALQAGYATASTDCGDPNPADALTGAFALHADGSYDRPRIADFARTGIHDLSVDGQALTAAFYRHEARYTYFDGCSGGGREALEEAQRFPRDYDGILAASPAVSWTRFVPAELWPQLVMAQHHDLLPTCKETAFTEAVVRACDARDGVTDGVVGDPDRCRWDPRRLVGTVTPSINLYIACIIIICAFI